MQSASRTHGGLSAGIAAVVICGALATGAHATISASDPFITVRATSGSFTGTVNVPLSDVIVVNDPDQDLFYWATTNPVPIFSGSTQVATLVNMTVLAGRNTQPSGEQRYGIDIDFGVQAGSAATTFELISPVLSFGPLANASALVSAGLVGSDQNSNGITISPAAANGFGFNALLNGPSVFRSYFNTTLSNVASGSVGADGNMVPAGAFQPVGTVGSMQSAYAFTLSAGDTAGGTTTFSVVPTPGAVALLGLSGLTLGRRRRV